MFAACDGPCGERVASELRRLAGSGGVMVSPVVVDGRVSRDKLIELLAVGAEHPELEFKTTLDLDTAPHRLGLVKDLIALANTGTGGYVVVGANDDGSPARDQAAVDARRFDSADLTQAVARHVLSVPILSSQSHDLNGWTFVVIHVAPSLNNLPCLVSKTGEYAVDKKMKVVLQEGVLYIREGTHTVTATDTHWIQLLSRYRGAAVAEAREGIDALIRKVVESMGEGSGAQRLAPLALEMEEEVFAEAVGPYLDTTEGRARLRRFVRSIAADIGIENQDEDKRSDALNKLAALAIQAILANATDTCEVAIRAFHDAYAASVEGFQGDYSPPPRASYWLDIVLRVICIGAVAVRDEAWWAIVPLVDRPGNHYYNVWLRHALVHASRAGLLSGGHREDALMLVKARALAAAHPALRPDVRLISREQAHSFAANDQLLNSLCQFDLMWCVVATLLHPDERESKLFFPSCAALEQGRSQPIILKIATSTDVRKATFADRTATEWASALKRVLDIAEQQSRQYGGEWWGDDDTGERVSSFVAQAKATEG